MSGNVHNRTRYLAGCRCDTCRKANSDYRRDLNRRKQEQKLTAVAELPTPEQSPPPAQPPATREDEAPARDSVQAKIREELDALAAIDEHPGLAATALAMGRILDSPVALAQQPAAARRLMELMDALGKGGRKKRGKLATVREMTAG